MNWNLIKYFAGYPAVHYRGNFGNLLFFWDVLFGTAKVTRSHPTSYGIENLVFPEDRTIPETELGSS